MKARAFTKLVNDRLKELGWKPKNLVDRITQLKPALEGLNLKAPSHNTVYAICKGRLPYVRVVEVLARALSMPDTPLYQAYHAQKEATAKKVEVVVKEAKLPKGEEELLAAYRSLPNHRKKQLKEFAAFLSKSVKG